MLSINAVKGIEFGAGFGMNSKRGSEVNDIFITIMAKLQQEPITVAEYREE